MAEFRRALRHDLLREETARRSRRVRRAIGGLAASVAVLMATLGLFVARPSVPQELNAALFHDPGSREEGVPPSGTSSMELRQLAADERFSAGADQRWINQLYSGEPEEASIRSSIDERFFALRRYELFSGRQVVVFTEVSSASPEEPRAPISPVRQF